MWSTEQSPYTWQGWIQLGGRLELQRVPLKTDLPTVVVEEWKTNLMPPAILFHFLCAQHVSDINISIIRSLRLCWWITTSVVLFVLQAEDCKTNTTQNQPHQISNTQRTENKTTDVVIQQHSRKLLMMDILRSETCWAHKKWNEIASDIKLVFHSSTITMMHGPINIRYAFSVNKPN